MIVGMNYKKVAEMSTRMNRPEMGVATRTSFQNKKIYFEFLSHFETRNLEKIKAGVLNHFDDSAKVNAGIYFCTVIKVIKNTSFYFF